ncbi:hypothetical protein [Planctomyces sp. SH-PL62]|uniref:hypothetical protein n=1 Tax=Planctomyces sp. SH-PL62 TaxID=1636152 RepID=UPI00078D0431|nr:hypothetical protein [Planctomyces sp. SH-PL62]AMV37375.1 hypothetical protein VT85_08070 [Planctomyces sp. SH-PL62]
MPSDPLRPLRLRWDDLRDPGAATGRQRVPALDAAPTRGTPRFVGRVRDAGAIPTATGRVFLVNPASLDGGESEGALATVAVDASRSVPVVVVGTKVPQAGDLIVAFAVGGRWIASLTGEPPSPVCGGCTAPRRDLTVSFTNSLLGPGSAVMAFNGVDEWTSGCVNQLTLRLICRNGQSSFQATYHTGTPCPGGQPVSCSSPGQAPLGLTPTGSSCTPFLLQFSLSAASCPSLAAQGYTRFTITI